MSIILEYHQPSWFASFEKEKNNILATNNAAFETIEHIGSTAVPLLPAKPIIDMLGIIANKGVFEDTIPLIVNLGYEFLSSFGLPGRYFFTKPGYHLHCYLHEHPDITRHLLFRDYLKSHASERDQYAALKKSLAKQYPNNRIAYTSGKTDFITEIEKKAGYHGFKIVQLLLPQEYDKANLLRKTKNLAPLSTYSDNLTHLALYFRAAIVGYACVEPNQKIITEMILESGSPSHFEKAFNKIIALSFKI